MFESPSGRQYGHVPVGPPKLDTVTGDGSSTLPVVTMEGQPARRWQPLLRAWRRQRRGDRVSGLPPICGYSSVVEPRSSKPLVGVSITPARSMDHWCKGTASRAFTPETTGQYRHGLPFDADGPATSRGFEPWRARFDTEVRCQQRSATGVGLLLIRAVHRDRHPAERPC